MKLITAVLISFNWSSFNECSPSNSAVVPLKVVFRGTLLKQASQNQYAKREFSEEQTCPKSCNRKLSTSLRGYSISFPSEATAEPDGKFSFHGSRPRKYFYTHKSLNLLSVLRIQYIQ